MTRVSGAACVELNTPRGGLGEHDARRGQLENPGKSSARAHLRSSKRSSVRRVSATSRDRKHADAARVRLRDVTRALGRSGRTKRTLAGSMLAGCRIQGSREQPGGLRVVGGIRGGSPPRTSLRDSKRLSTREDVARGAHVGRESGVLCPCRSGLRSGRDQGSESRLTCTPVMHSTRVHRPGNVIDFSNTPPSTSDSRQTFARENSHTEPRAPIHVTCKTPCRATPRRTGTGTDRI